MEDSLTADTTRMAGRLLPRPPECTPAHAHLRLSGFQSIIEARKLLLEARQLKSLFAVLVLSETMAAFQKRDVFPQRTYLHVRDFRKPSLPPLTSAVLLGQWQLWQPYEKF
uniref:Uncharacterized protein n=1 Tax=Ixodes ricinus TaxID=34613 RepID=A0A6B0UJF4_IXORI